jgi:GNAT superfamily N-acetyltransferase
MEENLLKWIDHSMNEFPYFNRDMIVRAMSSPFSDYAEFEDKGVFAYMIHEGFTRKKEMHEIFVYLKPEHRNLKNLNLLIAFIEQLAKEKGCDILKIGSNSGYRDASFLAFLERKGYKKDTMLKEI